jgi:pimeloyl-ACP methyl ester carboxylesterase
MRTWLRTIASLAALLAVGLGAMAGTAGAAPAATKAPAPKLAWEDCGDGFECATARVPRDHDDPSAGTMELSVIRKPATGPGRRLGSLFTNPGGPGGSGVDFLRGASEIFAGVNDRFDLVAWDPRGTPGSGPIDCLTPAERDARWPLTPGDPTIADLPVVAGLAQQLIAGCLAADEDGTLASFTTENTVRDLDLLRRAVGDRKLSYVGFSYGTYIGATYASLFPKRARALVLDGALDPERYANEPLEQLLSQSAEGFEVSLNRFFDWCATSPICGFEGGRPAFDRLLAATATTPLPATASGDPRPVLQIDVQNGVVLPLYSRQTWPLLADALALAQAGDGSLMLAISDAARGRDEEGNVAPGFDASSRRAASTSTTRRRPWTSRPSAGGPRSRRRSSGSRTTGTSWRPATSAPSGRSSRTTASRGLSPMSARGARRPWWSGTRPTPRRRSRARGRW